MSINGFKVKDSITKLLVGCSILATVLFFFWFFCLNHISVNTVGVVYNSLNGEINVQTNAGWYATSPFVKVVQLNILPLTVHIPSEARVINTKIVRLRPEGIRELVRIQGFGYNLNQNLENILMGYAFSGQTNSFLEIMQQGGPEVVSNRQ